MGDIDLILSEFNELKELIKSRPVEQPAAVPEIINTEELCKRLDLSEPTLISWRKKKVIPFMRVGSSIRYNWPKVIEALEKRNAK
jgi:excisionase family DNA binding protein